MKLFSWFKRKELPIKKELPIEELVNSMKRLISNPDWKNFVDHINNNIIPAHKDYGNMASFHRNTKEAEIQADIVETMTEVLEEPQNVIDTNDSNPIQKVCHYCGRLFEK